MADVLTLAAYAAVPIAVAFGLLVGLRWSAVRAMGAGWLVAAALGVVVWRMDPTWVAAAATYGALQAFNIVLIVFGAILLMNYLEGSGAVATIRWYFRRIAADRRVQLLLVGLGFETVMEGAAGFGTPGALAAPLFIGLGFPPLAAAVFGLYFNAPSPPFGAAGTPVIGGVGAVIGDALPAGMETFRFLDLVSAWTGVFTGIVFAFWGVLAVYLLVYWFGDAEERTLRGAVGPTLDVAPFALLLGTLAGATQWAVAWYVGPALPDIVAGFLALGVGLTLANRDVLVPDRTWEFPDRERWGDDWLGGLSLSDLDRTAPTKQMSVLLAWTPYLLVTAILLVTRWPTLTIGGREIVDVVGSYAVGFDVLGYDQLSWSLRYLYLPGTMPFVPVALLTGLVHDMEVGEMVDAWRESVRQVVPAALTLLVAVSMTQVMIQSGTNPLDRPGMMRALSRVLATSAGQALPVVAPWIGALGTFMTGSNASSDILFSVLQYEAAASVGVSRAIVVALQNTGGGIGNMISVLNVTAICGVVGISGREGDMLRKAIVPTVVFAVVAGALGWLCAHVLAPGVF